MQASDTELVERIKVGDKAAIKLDPSSDYFQVNNRIVTAASGTKKEIGIHRDPGSKQIDLWGSIPLDSKTEGEEIAVEDPAEFAAQIFRDLLVKRGVAVQGKYRAKHIVASDEPSVPEPGGGQTVDQSCSGANCVPATAAASGNAVRAVLAMHESKSFYEDLRVTNKALQGDSRYCAAFSPKPAFSRMNTFSAMPRDFRARRWRHRLRSRNYCDTSRPSGGRTSTWTLCRGQQSMAACASD